MIQNSTSQERFEISPRFRRSVEERIARLEQGAADDEARLILLSEPDHIRRQLRLVATQRCEAIRMRVFLDRSRVRPTPIGDLPQLG
jgi:hypothetical protein